MAQLNSLIVNGSSRFLNKAYFNDISVNGTMTMANASVTGNLSVSGTSTLTGHVAIGGYNNTSYALSANSAIINNWIRTIGVTGWYNESYGGGWYQSNSNYIRNYNKPVWLTHNLMIHSTYESGTPYFFKVDGSINASSINTGSINAGSATTGNLDVRGTLRSEQMDVQHVAQLFNDFAVSPTFKLSSGATISVTSISGTTVKLTIIDSTSISSDTIGGAKWTAGSQVQISGRIGNCVLGAARGTVDTNMNTTSGRLAITVTVAEASQLSVKTYAASEIHNVCAMLLTVGNYPVGIRLTSYGTNKNSQIDIYGGSQGSYSANYWHPTVRLGLLTGMKDASGNPIKVNNIEPSGWGLYTSNGFFQGVLVSTSGKIGGWTLDSNSLQMGSWGSDNSALLCTGSSTAKSIGGSANTVNGWVFTAGSKFGVTKNGDLYASNAQIAGKVTATSGTIGGWNIGTDTNKSLYTGTFGQSGSVYLSPGYTSNVEIADSNHYKSPGDGETAYTTWDWAITAGNGFGVTTNGYMFVNQGKIGSFFISNWDLLTYITGNGTYFSINAYDGERKQLSDSALEIGYRYYPKAALDEPIRTTYFRVTYDGVLEASGANIAGSITATNFVAKDSNGKTRAVVDVDGLKVFDASSNKVANFGNSIVVGDEAKSNLQLTSTSIVGKSNDADYFSITSDMSQSYVEAGTAHTITSLDHSSNITLPLADADKHSEGDYFIVTFEHEGDTPESFELVYGQAYGVFGRLVDFSMHGDNQLVGIRAHQSVTYSNVNVSFAWLAKTNKPAYIFGQLSHDYQSIGGYSFSCGKEVMPYGECTFVTGDNTTAKGYAAHAEGAYTYANGQVSHAEGYNCDALESYSHAEGMYTKVSAGGVAAHAEGSSTKASEYAAHAEGLSTIAAGYASHAGGQDSETKGSYSFAHGFNVKATQWGQFVIGQNNAYDDSYQTSSYSSDWFAFIIGNGENDSNRSNAFAVDWHGNIYLSGNIYDMDGNPLTIKAEWG